MKNEAIITSEQYPAKPITVLVPFNAGGNADIIARAMEKVAAKHLGQELVVTNIPGGGGAIGWSELADAKPDGYTIGVTTPGVILQTLYGPPGHHYPTALEPLVQVLTFPVTVAVLADQPWESIDDLVKYAQQYPGKIKCGHPGSGMPRHVVIEMLINKAGIELCQVPFAREAESSAALLGGHIQLLSAIPVEIKAFVKSGKVKVLAVAAEQRLTDPEFKNVQTFQEQGLDIVFNCWAGIGAPKDLPEDVKNKLTEGLKAVIYDPEFKKSIEHLGLTVEYLGLQESAAKWIAEQERFTKVVINTGIAERIAVQKK